MGCCSTKFVVREDVEGQGQEVLDTATRLGLTTSDLNAIFKKFKSYDVMKDEKVTIAEFVVISACEAETFISLVFRLFDHDGEGSVNFHEFLTAYYHFLTLDKDDLALFTYQVFDLDGEGSLSKDEVKVMCMTLWGQKKAEKQFKEMTKMDLDGDGTLDANEWLNICKHNPNMLFPAFSTQLLLRAGSLGAARWATLTKQRNKQFKSGKHYRSVLEINETGVKCDPSRGLLALKGVHGLPKSLRTKVDNAEKSVKKAAEIRRRNEDALKAQAKHYHTKGSDHSALSRSGSHNRSHNNNNTTLLSPGHHDHPHHDDSSHASKKSSKPGHGHNDDHHGHGAEGHSHKHDDAHHGHKSKHDDAHHGHKSNKVHASH